MLARALVGSSGHCAILTAISATSGARAPLPRAVGSAGVSGVPPVRSPGDHSGVLIVRRPQRPPSTLPSENTPATPVHAITAHVMPELAFLFAFLPPPPQLCQHVQTGTHACMQAGSAAESVASGMLEHMGWWW